MVNIQDVLDQIEYKDWNFRLGHENRNPDRPWLQVRFSVVDPDSGSERCWTVRKWMLSPHMTRSEIVQTALKAVLTAEEHEAREAFTYRGRAIFGPHFDVDALVELCDAGQLDVRSDAPAETAAVVSPAYKRLRTAAFDRLWALQDLQDARCEDEIDGANRRLRDADDELRAALEAIDG